MALVVVAAGLSACGGDDDDGAATTVPAASASVSAPASTVGNVLPPIIADLTSIDGTTVEVAVGGVIDLTGDDETFADWTAEVADPAVAEFTSGGIEGGASFNPGIEGLAPGTTAVTMTNPTSGTTVSFTVAVTGA